MTIHPQRRPKRRTGDKKEWPKMLFDENGNGKVFQSEADVPEGYAPRGEKPKAAAEPKQDSPNKGLAKSLGLKKQEIVAALTEAEIEFPANASVDDLAAIYQEAAEAAEDDEDDDDGED